MNKYSKIALVILIFWCLLHCICGQGWFVKKNKTQLNIVTKGTLKNSLAFNLKSGLCYKGSFLLNRQFIGNAIINDAFVSYKKGNTIYILPYKQKIAIPEYSQKDNAIKKQLSTMRLPPGYRITQGGEARDQAEVFTRIFTALGIAILLMYLILVMQFGSFVDPIAILISLPLSLIGVVLALLATIDTLNIMSLIGVMLLMGIVAKNAILLIDFAKWAREKGMSRRDALIEAGRIASRPIIMTTLALIAGMLPVAIGHGEGADFRAPLGRAVIGGVITSTLLTLIVIPTIYEILDEFKEWVRVRVFGRAPTPEHRTPELSAGD